VDANCANWKWSVEFAEKEGCNNMIKSSEKSFETVLHRAIRCNYLRVVKYLVSKGADVNKPFISISQKKKEAVMITEGEK